MAPPPPLLQHQQERKQLRPTEKQQLATSSTPATPKRVSVFSSHYAPHQAAPSVSNPNRFLSPSKKRQLLFGTPPVTRTPSRAPAPIPPPPATPRAEALKSLPDPPQLPDTRVGYDPELRSILSNHEDSLDKLIDRYSRLKSDLSHQLNVDLADLEHQRSNAKCELAVVQKQLAETVDSNERSKNELSAARNRLNQLTDDRRGMELKLDELNDVFANCQSKLKSLERKKTIERAELTQVIQDAKQEAKLLEDITGLSILIIGPDRLRFNFKLIDMNAYDRVFHVELDLSDFDYKISSIDPPFVEASASLKRLNQTRDFNRFLCDIRRGFHESIRR